MINFQWGEGLMYIEDEKMDFRQIVPSMQSNPSPKVSCKSAQNGNYGQLNKMRDERESAKKNWTPRTMLKIVSCLMTKMSVERRPGGGQWLMIILFETTYYLDSNPVLSLEVCFDNSSCRIQ